MDDRQCSTCGTALSGNAKFCQECGTKWGMYKCKGCEYVYKAVNKFCEECGVPNPNQPTSQTPKQVVKQDHTNDGQMIGQEGQEGCREVTNSDRVSEQREEQDGQNKDMARPNRQVDGQKGAADSTDECSEMTTSGGIERQTGGQEERQNNKVCADIGEFRAKENHATEASWGTGENVHVSGTPGDQVMANRKGETSVLDDDQTISPGTDGQINKQTGSNEGQLNEQKTRTGADRDDKADQTCGMEGSNEQDIDNQSNGPKASTLAAGENQISDQQASTSSGGQNQISDQQASSMTGGQKQISDQQARPATAGQNQFSDQQVNSMTGGQNQFSDQQASTMTSGQNQISDQQVSSMTGGQNQFSDQQASTMTGGQNQFSDQQASTMTGGQNQFSDQQASTASVGQNQISDQQASTAIGGQNQFSDQQASTMTGGQNQFSDQQASTMTGGQNQFSDQQARTMTGGQNQFSDQQVSTATGGQNQFSHQQVSTPSVDDDQVTGSLMPEGHNQSNGEMNNTSASCWHKVADQATSQITSGADQSNNQVTRKDDNRDQQPTDNVEGDTSRQLTDVAVEEGSNQEQQMRTPLGTEQTGEGLAASLKSAIPQASESANTSNHTQETVNQEVKPDKSSLNDEAQREGDGRNKSKNNQQKKPMDDLTQSKPESSDGPQTRSMTAANKKAKNQQSNRNQKEAGITENVGQSKGQGSIGHSDQSTGDKADVGEGSFVVDPVVGTDLDKQYNIRKTGNNTLAVSFKGSSLNQGGTGVSGGGENTSTQEKVQPDGDDKFSSVFGNDVKNQKIRNQESGHPPQGDKVFGGNNNKEVNLAEAKKGKEKDAVATRQAGGNHTQDDSNMKAYKKSDNQPEEYHPAKQKAKSGKENMPEQLTRDELCNVTFHVVVGPDFKFCPSQDRVVIQFQHAHLGGFGCKDYVLSKDRFVEIDKNRYYVMHLSVDLPKRIIHSGNLNYIYGVHTQEKLENEFLYHKPKDAGFRRLVVNAQDISSVPTTWLQYDGMMHPKPDKNILFKVYSFFSNEEYKTFVKNNILSATLLMPRWEGFTSAMVSPELNFSSALERMFQLYRTMYTLFIEKGNSRKHDKSQFQQALNNYFYEALSRLEDHMHKHRDQKLSPEEIVLDMLTALALIYLMVNFNMISKDNKAHQALLWAFVVTPDNENKTCPEYTEILETHLKGRKGVFGDALLNFCAAINSNGYSSEPTWLFAVPMIHLLKGESTCFTRLPVIAKHQTPQWWGVQSVSKLVEDYKWHMSVGNKMPIDLYLKHLVPMFGLDPLLPRTLLAVMSPRHLCQLFSSQDIAPEICLANVCYFFQTNQLFGTQENMIAELAPPVISMLEKQQMTKAKDIDADLHDAKAMVYIAQDFVIYAINHLYSTRSYPTAKTAVQVVVASIDRISLLLAQEAQQQDTKVNQAKWQKVLIHLVKSLAEAVTDWLSAKLPTNMIEIWTYGNTSRVHLKDDTELKIYSWLVTVKFQQNKESNEVWIDWFLGFLRNRLKSVSCKNKVALLCTLKSDEYHALVVDQITKCVFDEIEGADKTHLSDCSALVDEVKNPQEAHRLGLLFSTMFVKSWPQYQGKLSTEKLVVMKHVLEWSSFCRYLKFFYGNQLSGLLSDTCSELMTLAVSLVESVSEMLLSGDVQICMLQVTLEGCHFATVYLAILENSQVAKEEADSQTRILTKALTRRKEELDRLQETRRTLKSLINYCKDFPVTLSDLEAYLNQPVDQLVLSDVCETKSFTGNNAEEESELVTLRIDQPDEVLTMARELTHLEKSAIFARIWTSYGWKAHKDKKALHENDDIPLTLQEVADQVWNPTDRKISEICNNLRTGKITLNEVDNLFSDYNGKYKQLREDLTALCGSNQGSGWVKDQVTKIEKYHRMNRYKEGARKMKDVVQVLGLTGNFRVLDTLLSVESDKSTCLGDISETVMSVGEDLMDVTDEMTSCVGVLGECQSLVQWLRKLNGTKEVKVLVDLAMMSAQGQGDLEVEKVQCLSDASMGYAPLIYELPVDADFSQFFAQCQLVWRTLATNPNLPKRLSELSRNLSWLENIEKSHGSTETNSLSQVQTINSRGIFKVGCISKGNQQNQTLDHVIELRIKPDTEQAESGDGPEVRVLSLQQLNDLQSRLMLVVGRGEQRKEDVDRFMEILDGVTQLGKLYIKLCSAGSIIFKNWCATFDCDPKAKVIADINFGLSEKMLQAPRGTMLTTQIKELIDFLKYCFDQWTEDIGSKRQEFYQLNHFTTEQLVILRSGLASVCKGEAGQASIYALLDAVKPGCSKQDLQSALQSAILKLVPSATEGESTEKCEISENQVSGGAEEEEEQENAHSGHKVEDVQAFIQELVDTGHSERLALEAFRQLDSTDLQEGIMWCMENEDKDNQTGEKQEEVNQPEHPDTEGLNLQVPDTPSLDLSSLGMQDTSMDMMKSLLEGLTQPKSSLKDHLISLWEKHINQSGVSSVSDFLSLKHLAVILEELASQDKQPLDRPFPEGFTKGKPNLVICPQGDLLASVLSLYMYGKGLNLPLPTTGEVLMCSVDTSIEQVDLLLRRCFHSPDNRLFCLVNADLLDYDVSSHTENAFEKLSRQATKTEFRLVIVVSSEQSDKSGLVTAFDKFRIKNQLVCPTREIQAYLKDKFTIQDEEAGTGVDPESLCVRMVQSHRAGVGKSLKVLRIAEQMKELGVEETHISIHKRGVEKEKVLGELLPKTQHPEDQRPHLVHIDIAHQVQEGVDELLFSLLVLGRLTAVSGAVWLRRQRHLYLLEVLPLIENVTVSKDKVSKSRHVHSMLQFLPKLTCWAPKDSLFLLQRLQQQEEPGELFLTSHPDYQSFDQLMDLGQFESPSWQRVYQYLKRYQTNGNLDTVNPTQVEGTPAQCIETLLRYCGLVDPSWAELRHFVHFLDIQLKDCEESSFCSSFVSQDLPGFKLFVIKLMIQMSRDFATRSLNISEESPGMLHQQETEDEEEEPAEGIEQFQMKRTWESSPHPYLFFNSDHHSLTFLGFNIQRRTCHMIDVQTQKVLEESVMTKQLQDALIRNHVPLQEDFDKLSREDKITKLCNVMGNDLPGGYDDTYVLTTDNAKKILAIYMRFRCDIPVIIMGETGCGKTRLVRFMCELQKPAGVEMQNMVLMKVHGGTTEKDIRETLAEATELARQNRKDFPHMYTVLFFDEANTTEEIGLIKQVMCDRVFARDQDESGLKMVAACNPYRKHSEEMVKRLEAAGLGYHIKAEQTTDKLGHVPLRRLVYRVQALSQSLLPLVWDFGQLDTHTEQMYIQQMVDKFVSMKKLPSAFNLATNVSCILAASQDYMRQQRDECSFVSLRDVERVLCVMAWFHQHRDVLYPLMDAKAQQDFRSQYRSEEEEMQYRPPNALTRSLILALGVCYQACLQDKREDYRLHVAQHFSHPLSLENGAQTIEEQINSCQEVFLSHVSLEDNIARNQALKENVFMMVVCIELRIPLFLVGKPGSSKSLAKTIVADAMQGDTSKTDIFKQLKFAHMVSFQCSPLSSPEGIVGMFQQCATLQQKKELDKYVSVVVLDEVGLAEDSPRMPLKTLHPLLEDGCQGNEKPEPYKKVAFIGISNWALDPAKMNRGILVQRGVPDEKELVRSARLNSWVTKRSPQAPISHMLRGDLIFNVDPCWLSQPNIAVEFGLGDRTIKQTMQNFLEPLAKGYLRLYRKAIETESREFFGLRDFYSIVKMVNAFAKRSGSKPTWLELKHSILRNFGGLESVDSLKEFKEEMQDLVRSKERKSTDPDCSAPGLIRACLFGKGVEDINSQSRYLLILTENYAALKIIEQQLFKLDDAIIIFGSSFPRDQEYTQVCRNINRIKMCMETGKTVVLLNLQNLYESLYDALNQYYVYFGGQQFVDLGLGTHRVKCRVHKNFRLIVVAEKQTVYKTFPIPLINRLEKHTLTMETMLSSQQKELTKQLEHWVKTYSAARPQQVMSRQKPLTEGDVFIGYDKDTAAAIVLQLTEELENRQRQTHDMEPHGTAREDAEQMGQVEKEELLRLAKQLLLCCATPESVLLVRHSHLKAEERELRQIYFSRQSHDNMGQFLQQHLQGEPKLLAQVTTHSRLLSAADKVTLCHDLHLDPGAVWLQSLQAFDTEQQFTKMLRDFFDSPTSCLLILQCDSGDEHATMIASARYNLTQEGGQQGAAENAKHVLLVVQLPRKAGGCFVGFQGGRWLCYHIDDLHPDEGGVPSLSVLQEHSLGELFSATVNSQDPQCDGLVQAFSGLQLNRRSQDTGIGPLGGQIDEETDNTKNNTEMEETTVDRERETTGSRVNPDSGDTEASNTHDDLDDAGETGSVRDVSQVNFQLVGPEANQNMMDDLTERGMAEGVSAREVIGVAKGGRIERNQCLDVDRVLKNCVHGAAAMLEEEQTSSQRKTERVSKLLRLMEALDGADSAEKKSFLSVVRRRVALLLRDKEEQLTMTTRATSWLTQDAASQQAIVRAGTLRHSVRQHIEVKVTPVLAAVLAYCDADSNLDHMTAEDTPDWLRQLWLDLLNAENLTRLTFRTLSGAQSDQSHIQIQQHGHRGHRFKARLPFSWTIRELTEELIYNTNNTRGFEEASFEERLSQQFSASPVGQILAKIKPDVLPELMERYLHDLVSMGYCPETDSSQEIQLLCDAVQSAAIHQHLRKESGEKFQLDIPTMHQVWAELQPRVHLVEQVLVQWPEALREIIEFRENHPEHALNTGWEFTIDIQMLSLVLEHLSPQLRKDKRKVLDELDSSAKSRQGWMARVDRFSSVVEKIFDHMTRMRGPMELSDKSQEFVRTASVLWSRISAVRLLTQYVHADNEGELKFKKCFPMWKFLTETTDFKKLETVKMVEKFLKSSNIGVFKQYLGSIEKCPRCDEHLDNPILLPCGHKVCATCTQLLLNSSEGTCPQCKTAFSEADTKLGIDPQKQEAHAKYKNYKKQCNAFFMAVVSQLCFRGDSPPDAKVVTHLLGLITQEAAGSQAERSGEASGTRQMVALKDMEAIDSTPVVRSFLLQMLLRSHDTQVQEHVDEYFRSCREVLKEDHTQEVVLLFVNCWEDSLHRKYQQVPPRQQISYVTHLLSQASSYLTSPGLEVTKLKSVATVRYGLYVVAGWMAKAEQDRKLLRAAQRVCEGELVWPRLYLLRQLNRFHGVTKLQEVVAGTTWLQEAGPQNTRQPDRFLIYGENYFSLCQSLGQVLISGDVDAFVPSLTNFKSMQDVLLSVYTEITLSNQVAEEEKKIHPDILDKLDTVLKGRIKQKELVSELIRNGLGRNEVRLQVRPGDPGQVNMVRELLVHMLVMLTTKEDSNLTQPLRLLATKPQKMLHRFLPTMPQDDLVYINQAMQNWLRETNKPKYEKLDVYKCPNGHAYLIGECGRPYSKGKCLECGALVGGLSHHLEAGNVKVESVTDATAQGHTLGAPASRQKEAIPERKLSPAATLLLRLLTHIAMSLGSNIHPEEMVQLIVPPLQEGGVMDFLFGHITCDLEVLAGTLGRSVEDCVLLVNLLIRNIGRDIEKYPRVDGSLQTKESREVWEERFSVTYIQPVLHNMKEELEQAHAAMMADTRMGNNQFLRQVYEAGTLPEYVLDQDHVEQMPALWRLRNRVTIEQLLQEVNTTMSRSDRGHTQRALQLFLTQMHKLTGLRFLPRIVRLQQMLIQHYSGAISKLDAEATNVRQMLMDLPQGRVSDEIQSLVEDVGEAWKLLREHLKNFSFVGHTLHSHDCEVDLSMDTPLAALLPSWKGQGLLSLAMVYFLCTIQNHFLERYSEMAEIHLPDPVSVQTASPADIVSFHPERELLPLVVAGCHYSVSRETGLSHSYDLDTIGTEVNQRFIRGRARLLPEVPTVLYREEFTNAARFAALHEKVPQERLPLTLQADISKECTQMTPLTQSLSRLEVAVAFLVSVGGDPKTPLGEFMKKTLKMSKALNSDRAMQHCTVSQVQHLWLVLSHERAKLQAKYKQDPFGHIPASYCEDLDPEVHPLLIEALHRTNVPALMEGLYMYIILGAKDRGPPVQSGADGEETDDTGYPLGYTLDAFLESYGCDSIPILTERFPDQLLVKHVVSTWLEAYRYHRSETK